MNINHKNPCRGPSPSGNRVVTFIQTLIDFSIQVGYHNGMKKQGWKSTPNAVYQINYHFVWSTKYRRKVLAPPIDDSLKALFSQITEAHGYELLGCEVRVDQVHLVLSAPPKDSPSVMAKILKGSSAKMLYAKHPELRTKLWGGHLWNPSFYVGTAGHVSAETIQKYIESQKTNANTNH